MDCGYTVLKFEEILAGEAGEVEARAARKWLEAGAPVQPLPSDLVTKDVTGFDTRIIDRELMKRHKRFLKEKAAAAQTKQMKRSKSGSAGKGEQAKGQRGKSKQPKAKQRQRATGTKSGYYEENIYSRAAFVSHGDAIGSLARRRARGPRPPRSTAGALPPGWQATVKTVKAGPSAGSKYKVYLHQESGRSFPTLAQAQAHWEAEAQAACADPAAAADELPPGWRLVWVPEEDAAGREALYRSPEGLVFDEWREAEAWLDADVSSHPCPPPPELLSTLRTAAVGGVRAEGLQRLQSTLLGLHRARLAQQGE